MSQITNLVTGGGGGGDVSGPGSSTNRAIATWDGITGTALFDNSTTNIDSTGRYTNTAQPAFRAYLSTVTNDVTGDGTNYTVIFNNEVFDRGSNYDNTTGIFTAPVAGIYQFNFAIGYQNIDASHTSGAIFLFAGGIQYVGQLVNAFAVSTSGFWQSNLTVIVSLTASDTVYCIAYIANGTKTVDLYNDQTFTFFSGALLF